MATTPADKFLAALNRSYDAMTDVIEKGSQRGYRASKGALRQARRGEREVVALAKKWSEEPTDLLKFYESILDAQTRAQTRALELAREWLDEAEEVRGEAREALQRMIRANQDAADAVLETTRGVFAMAVSRVRGGTGEAPAEAPPAGAGARRRTRRAPARKAPARRRKSAESTGGRPAPGA